MMPVSGILSLSVETSSRVGGVVLARGPQVLEVAEFSAELRHAVELLPGVEALCRKHRVAPAAIHEVYVSVGPGSFTGLRIGITFAKTLAAAGHARLVGVPTLDIIAQNALVLPDPPPHLAVLLDAKRERAYAGAFELVRDAERRDRAYRPVAPAAEVDPVDFLARMPHGSAVLGEGVAAHQKVVAASRLRILPPEYHRPRAEAVFQLGWESARADKFNDPIHLTPTYIRRPEAEEVYERRHPT